jgi:hypothetical protein
VAQLAVSEQAGNPTSSVLRQAPLLVLIAE